LTRDSGDEWVVKVELSAIVGAKTVQERFPEWGRFYKWDRFAWKQRKRETVG
jgi:hypothetical protein